MTSRPSARRLAWRVLYDWTRNPATRVDAELHRRTADHPLPAAERALALELVQGVVRRQATLDLLLRHVVRRPLSHLEPGLLVLLRLGTEQLVFLPEMPRHAAVHETVEVARRERKSRWVGLANAVLRSISQLLASREEAHVDTSLIPLAPAETTPAVPHGTDGTASGALPRYSGLRLTSPLLPDPASQPVPYLAQACSLPEWLVERRLRSISWEDCLRECTWFNTPGRLCLRVNLLRATREDVLRQLHASGLAAQPGLLPESIRVTGTAPLVGRTWLTGGLATPQDESAMWAAELLNPQPGERIWDVCAAPGGKTTHLAERARAQASILATDVSASRLRRVLEARDRLGLTGIETHPISIGGEDLPDGPFDAILLDVPCSNTGVLGKRPEVRWRLSPRDFEELTALQARLLDRAADRLAPGGRLLYSTCSVDADENQSQVARFLHRHPGWQQVFEREHLPGQPADGGYMALLQPG